MDPLVWSVILILLGLALMTAEIFIPSGGVLGVLTFTSLTAGVVVAFWKSPAYGALMLGIVAVSLPIFLAIAVKVWPETPIGRRVMLWRPKTAEEVLPESDHPTGLRSLVGRRGLTKSKMMPGGIVAIGKATYDAVTEGDPMEIGQRIVVVGVQLRRLMVRLDESPVSDDAPNTPPPAKPSLAEPPPTPWPPRESLASQAPAPSSDSPKPGDELSRPVNELEALGGIEDPFK